MYGGLEENARFTGHLNSYDISRLTLDRVTSVTTAVVASIYVATLSLAVDLVIRCDARNDPLIVHRDAPLLRPGMHPRGNVHMLDPDDHGDLEQYILRQVERETLYVGNGGNVRGGS